MLISAWLTAVRSRLQSPGTVKRRSKGKKAAEASMEVLETRALLAATLQAVRPNVGDFLAQNETRTVAPQELTLQFSLGSTITPSSISSKSIEVFRSGRDGLFGNGNDVPVTIGYVGPGNSPNEVVLRFGENLQDDHYRIITHGSGPDVLTETIVGGSPVNQPVLDSQWNFNLDLGAQVVAVDPQPVTVNANGSVSQSRNQIVVYFNQDTLDTTSAQTAGFYQLIFTNESVTNLDDVKHNPASVVYDPVSKTSTLTFASDLAALPGAGPGTYRLRIGNAEVTPEAPITQFNFVDVGDSYTTATSIGVISDTGNHSHIVRSTIDPLPYGFTFPGANDDQGNRQIEVEQHVNGSADTTPGISQIDYNFQDVYGTDPLGTILHNVITDAQKQRAREVFEYYGTYLGIDFRETATSGLTIVTGDLRALDPTIPTGPGGVAGLAGGGVAIMDQAEVWDDSAGADWFETAMHEIGHLLGQGHTYDLPVSTIQGSNPGATQGNVEPTFPGVQDVIHGQYQYRPDSVDIDLYRFTVAPGQSGVFTTEVIAERLADSSRLDSAIRLFRENPDGSREMIAQNNDYFSSDSYLQLALTEGTYFIGISSTGNEAYDPTISGTGIGGTSQGTYQLRMDFRPAETTTLVDTTGTHFDGDADGKAGGVYDFWFKTATAAETLFVSKGAISTLSNAVNAFVGSTQIVVQSVTPFAVGNTIRIDSEQMQITAINPSTRALTVTRAVNATILANHAAGAVVSQAGANGSQALPFGRISDATAVATAAANAGITGKIIRVVGNGGADGVLSTLGDNNPYQIGFNASNAPLQDGSTLEVPKGTTLMIDGGAVLKLNKALIGVGSSSSGVDRSGGSLQVLGTPLRNVTFTSWTDETIGTDTTPTPTSAQAGDWGGLAFRSTVDRTESRLNYQSRGIFLNYVANADIRWGGGNVIVDSVLQTINPIFIDGSQPTIVYNRITNSQDSAVSANPDSFEEFTFHSPRFQDGAAAFTSDYVRVGPEIHGNILLNNSTNGLFVRVNTAAGSSTQKLTVAGRFNDTDIAHVIAQNLQIQGTPGGPILDQIQVSVNLTTLTPRVGGTLPVGLYNYILVATDDSGAEGPSSLGNTTVSLTTTSTGSIELNGLPSATGSYTGRNLYRSTAGGVGPYTLVGQLDRSATKFTDNGTNLSRILAPLASRNRARTDARLSVDPGVILKLEGARIEAEIGTQFIAEGESGRPVIFTSRLDDRYGTSGTVLNLVRDAGKAGTFDTNNDDNNVPAEAQPSPGNWGGVYVGQLGSVSIDRAQINYGGGIIPVGSNFAGFNPIEIHQATGRISDTVFENNASGVGGTADAYREGRFPNSAGTIFVRSAQPVILNNTFKNNIGAGININAEALNSTAIVDLGRSTGLAERELSYLDNQGPFIRFNQFGGNTLNGMRVRGETVKTQGVWDDTDIVHIVLDEIYIPDTQHYGGIRLESRSTESLVIKLDDTFGPAGFVVNGYPLDIVDRIGGSLQIVGQAGQPVVLTSLKDDTVGAGFDTFGVPLRDTNNDGPSVGVAGDWKGIQVDEYANDRNVAAYVERELGDRFSADTNGSIGTAEQIGLLARDQKSGDENLRLGFEIQGSVDSTNDTDIYSFRGIAGTGVWIDIDRTTQALDSVVELLDANGNILVISDNVDEAVAIDPSINVHTLAYANSGVSDLYTFNAHDAGFRLILPGTAGAAQPYFVRVRSSNATPLTQLDGLTSGIYQLQIRLQELDEFPGTQITQADIRFAETGIGINGQPAHSPLLGESAESDFSTGVSSVTIGNLMNTDRAALSLAGKLGTPIAAVGGAATTPALRANATYDVDFWEFTVQYDATQQIAGASTIGPHVPVTIDLDFADGFSRADVTAAVYDSQNRLILIGRDSNISDDQPKPANGSDTADLSRGSAGKLDPFIGPVELIGGQTYRLAIIPNDIVPQVLNQFWTANPTAPLVRFEPVNSTKRIAEERFDPQGLILARDSSGALILDAFGFPTFVTGPTDEQSTAAQPVTDLFTVGASGVLDPKHIVPFTLGDVTLFVSQARGITGNNASVVSTVDPFTGANETLLGQFNQRSGDIAMRGDGQMHTFSTGTPGQAFSDGNVGNYLRIDTGTAAVTNMGDDGISTNILNAGNAAAHDVGISFNAMTYTGTNDTNLWAVGNRSQLGLKAGQTGAVAAQYTRNILYSFNTGSGDQINPGNGGDRQNAAVAVSGAGTTQVDWGQIDTSFLNGGLNGDITGMTVIGGQFYFVDNAGGLYRRTVGTSGVQATFIANVGGLNINFAGLSLGPDEVEGGKYANTLFGISTTGRLYAFNTAGALQPIFNDAQTSVQVAGVSNVTGLAFGTLDRNLWHNTTNRGGLTAPDDGHGIDVAPFDNSVFLPVPGGNSLYFGNERTGNSSGNKNTDGNNNPNNSAPKRDIDFPGGAHGTIVSNEFSLQGYSPNDKPVLYFNYFLDTENANYVYGTNPDTLMRDSFRVFVSDESGQWNLLTTNNSLHDSVRDDEFDIGPDGIFETPAPVTQTFVDVTETFDNTNGWRQARVDLSNFAGRAGLKLRFDFSTAGSMNVGDIQTTGSELYAVKASQLTDEQTFSIDGRTFEFDMGAHMTIPSGGNLEGVTFTVLGTTFRYTATPSVTNDILALPTESAAVIAARTNAFINGVLNGTSIRIPNATGLEGESFTIIDSASVHTTFTYTATPTAPTDILAVTGDSANTLTSRTAARVNAVLGVGKALVNGTQVDFPGVPTVTFGGSINASSSASLEGESITFNGQTFTFTSVPQLASDIVIAFGQPASVVAANAVAVINSVLGVGTAFVDPAAPTRISIPDIPDAASSIVTGGTLVLADVTTPTTMEGESITVFGTTFTYTAIPSQPNDILAVFGDTAATIALRTRDAFNAVFDTVGNPPTSYVDPLAPNRVSIPDLPTFYNSFVRGGTLTTPGGTNLAGQEFEVNGQVFRYSTSPASANEILARTGDSATLIANRTAAAINAVLGTNASGDPVAVANLNRVSVSDLSSSFNGFFLGETLSFVDATATNYEGESFTAFGRTFTFRDPAALPLPIVATGQSLITAVDGDTAATLATRAATAINNFLGRTAATASGSDVTIAGAVTAALGGTLRVISTAAADLDNDSLIVNGFQFRFVGGAPGNIQEIQTDANPVIVAQRIVTAVNNLFSSFFTSTNFTPLFSNGTVVSAPSDTTMFYINSGVTAVGLSVLDSFGSPMSFSLLSNPGGTAFVADEVNSPLGVDPRSTTFTHDIVDSTLSIIPGFITSYVSENRITIPGADAANLTSTVGSPLVISGGIGTSIGATPVSVFPNMTANQVAIAIRQGIADFFAAGDINIIKGAEDRIQIIGHFVNDQGPLNLVTSLPGDDFGAFNAGFVNGQATRPGSLRGMNNAVEGVYIDDIIIGFAERGEMVTNAPATTTMIPNNDLYDPNRILGNNYLGIADGAYDVEIRRATDYGESQNPNPTNILYRVLDTNDREADAIAITLPKADQIPHGATFELSDGWRSVTFQFIDDYIGLSALIPGNIPLVFNSLETLFALDQFGFEQSLGFNVNEELVAKLVVDAINSPAVQNVLGVKAMYSDTTAPDLVADNRTDTLPAVSFFGVTSNPPSRTIHLTGNAIFTPSALLANLVTTTTYSAYGDQNRSRDQGQIIVQSSTVRDSLNYGINVDAAPRGTAAVGSNPTPHPGAVKNTQEENTARLATGVVIMNNLITGNVVGGVRFSGDAVNNPVGAVPYGRIVNNTIVGVNGGQLGVGIDVNESASPTLLNNILADLTTGVRVDGSSQSAGTTIGATLYRGNGTHFNTGGLGAGTFPIVLNSTDPLFVDQANNNYYPAPFAQSIDSSLNSLGDRADMIRVKGPLGLAGTPASGSSVFPGSPILAPAVDVFGQLRGDDDDVATPAGQGGNVFVDRGAIDRVDFFQPRAVLTLPEDQSSIDGDPIVDAVWIDQPQTLRQFRIRLDDQGIGVDGTTVSSSQFVIKRIATDGITEITLTDGVDYTFVYDVVTREAIFNAATFFADADTEARYSITVDNDDVAGTDVVNGVRDQAGNYLQANQLDGTTRFDIVLTDGVNDPPVNVVPGNQTTPEDAPLVFNATNGNAISVSDQDAYLGTNVLSVTLTATNGKLTLVTIPVGLVFGTGDGTDDLTMEFTGKLQDLNLALEGLTFTPDLDFAGAASISILTNDLGQFSGPPASSTLDVIAIDVTPVNDPPIFTLAGNPAAVNEDSVLVTVPAFMTGQAPGPANESAETISVQTTVISVGGTATGRWNINNFFTVAPSIDPITGNLTYQAATDVNGTATIRVVLTDNGVPAASSVAQTFVITVNAINDAPVFTPTSIDTRVNGSGNITTLEDAGLQTINYVATSATARSTALDELTAQTLSWSRSTPTTTQGTLAFSQLTVNPTTGVITYNTVADTHGTATFVLTLTDNGLSGSPHVNLVTRTITINVTPVNDAPVARTGNYVVDEQYGLTLDASASTDIDSYFISGSDTFNDVLRYAWDLDNNGTYETSSNTSPTLTLTWADLANLGITAPSVNNIKLRVTDSSGAANNTGLATATLTTLIVDYGDAPNSYGTLKSGNGAAHTIANGLFLGSTVTKEITGQPSTAANLDTGDDGVTFPTSIETTAGQALPSYVDVVSSKAGKLDIWLDLNGNGSFDDATEQLNAGVSYDVVAGTQRIEFSVPAGATAGSSFMRFRLSTAGTALPTGRANDGEVEDYAVQIKALQPPVPPTFILPIDFNGTTSPVAQTSDLTPTISWSLHDANYKYNLVVTNSSSTPVLTVNNTSFTSATVATNLPAGHYTATLTAFNKANVAALPVIWEFDVVPLVVSSPTGDVTTSRPVINWNHVLGTKSYRVVVESLTNGSTVINQTIVTASVVSPAIPNRLIPTSDLPIGEYRVRVQATDAADLLGDWSAYSSFTVRTAPVLTAPAATTNDLRPVVSWNPVAGAVSYRVTLSFVTDTGVAPVTAIVSGTSWTPTTDLKLGEYTVKVQGFSSTNAGGQSSVESLLRTFAVKTPPVSTQPIGRVADTTPTFSWTAVPGADRYELIVSKAWGDLAEVVHWSALTGTSFTQQTKLELGPYTYQIRGINNASAVGASNVTSSFAAVYSFSIVEPPVVTGPELTTFSNHPKVSWVAPSNSETFDIYYRLVGDSNPEFLRVNGVTGTSYTPNEKVFGIGTYMVWVRTYSNTDNPATPRLPNGTGDERVVSNWSLPRTFRVSTPPTLIGPSGRTSVANPTLTWQSVPGALSYEIWINNNSVPVGKIYNQKGISALNYTVPANLPIGQYTFWVRARNQFGFDSNWSQPKTFSVTAWPTITGPSSSTFDTTPTFNWTNMTSTLGGLTAGAARYDFRIYGIDPATKQYVELPQYTVTTLTATTYTIPADKALPAGNYRAYVRGIANGRPTAGVPETISDFSFGLPFYVGGIPVVTALPITTNTTPTLLWQAVNGASGYEVFLSTAALPNTNLLNSLNNKTGGTSFVVPQALNKGVYRYWIRAINASTGVAGNWSERNTLTIVDAGDAGSEQLQNEPTEFVWTVLPGFVPQSIVTESAVSMVPAIVDGSQYLPLPAEEILTVSPASPVNGEVEVVSAEDSVAVEQTDSVLSKWDEQLWWESQPQAEKSAVSDQKVSAAGFLGALFAMAPRSIRRRKNEE